MINVNQSYNVIGKANITNTVNNPNYSTLWNSILGKPDGLTQANVDEWNALKAKLDYWISLGGGGGSYAPVPATTSILGVVMIGSNINVTPEGVISVPVASRYTKGVAKFSTDFTVDANGTVSLAGGTVGIATPDDPGIVMPGDDFDIDTTTGLLTLYKALTINGWSVNNTMAEVGSSVANVTGTFSLSKTPTVLKAGVSGSLADITLEQSGTTTITGPFTSNTTFVISAKDAKQANPVTSNAYLKFGKYYYAYEASSDSVNPTSSSIQTWGKGLTTTAARTITMSNERYLYYAVPSDWTLTKYTVGGFDYTWVTVNASLSVTTSNNTTTYKVVRTASKINTGASVVIS